MLWLLTADANQRLNT